MDSFGSNRDESQAFLPASEAVEVWRISLKHSLVLK
jgi:hypothetical protein